MQLKRRKIRKTPITMATRTILILCQALDCGSWMVNLPSAIISPCIITIPVIIAITNGRSISLGLACDERATKGQASRHKAQLKKTGNITRETYYCLGKITIARGV